MSRLLTLFKEHKTKLILMKISSLQVFMNFFISLLVLRNVGVGAELDVYYIAMAVFAFLYSSVNWSIVSITSPYLIQHRCENKEGRVLVAVLCIVTPVALLLGLSLPLWGKLLFINYIGEVEISKIYTVQLILIVAYFVDGLIMVFNSMLQEKNKYITYNASMALASMVGLIFVYFTIDHIGVYAAALNQLLMKVFIFIWLFILFFKSIKPYIAFDKDIFKELVKRTKYILAGSLYFKTDEIVEKFVASYLTAGLVSIIGFIQRVYGAFVTVLNSAIGLPSMTVFSNYIKEGRVKDVRPILMRYILALTVISFCIFVAIHFVGETVFVWMMGDKLSADLIPTLNLAMYMLFAFVYFKPISLVLQTLLLSLNKGDIATAYDSVIYTFNVGLKIILTILYGIEGLLVAILIGYALVDIAKFYLVVKELSNAENTLDN